MGRYNRRNTLINGFLWVGTVVMLIAFFIVRAMCYDKLDEIDITFTEIEVMLSEESTVVPSATPEPTVIPSITPKEPIDNTPYYDIELSDELQKYTYEICSEYGVDYELVLSVMYSESRYLVDAMNGNSDFGLMQINKCNHKWLSETLGITDIMDPKQNILSGVYILSLYTKYEDYNKMLMAYNMGPGGAYELWQQGVYSTGYSRETLSYMNDTLLQLTREHPVVQNRIDR